MKKLHFWNKAIIFLIIIVMTIFAFTGCQSKSSQNSTNTNANTAQGGPNRNFDPTQMKQQIENDIKPLVEDGTITQDQADQIADAYTSNTPKFSGQGGFRNRQSGNGQNGSGNNGQPSQNSNGNSGQSNNGSSSAPNGSGNSTNNFQNRQRFNPLSKLVTDKVITQTQANAVMQKIRGSFAGRRGNFGGGSQDSSQSGSQGSSAAN